jgi:hypothetical protein
MAVENTRIVQRGLVLLAVVGAISLTVLIALLRRPGLGEQRVENRPAQAAAAFQAPMGNFPANLPWGALYQLGDALPSRPGWEIRYTATRVLANHGSPKIRLDVLCEMLDEQRQLRNFQAKLSDGRVVPDEGAAAEEVVIALRAVSEWHKHSAAVQAVGSDSPQMQKLTRAVEKLTHSRNNVVQTRAQETLLALQRK